MWGREGAAVTGGAVGCSHCGATGGWHYNTCPTLAGSQRTPEERLSDLEARVAALEEADRKHHGVTVTITPSPEIPIRPPDSGDNVSRE